MQILFSECCELAELLDIISCVSKALLEDWRTWWVGFTRGCMVPLWHTQTVSGPRADADETIFAQLPDRVLLALQQSCRQAAGPKIIGETTSCETCGWALWWVFRVSDGFISHHWCCGSWLHSSHACLGPHSTQHRLGSWHGVRPWCKRRVCQRIPKTATNLYHSLVGRPAWGLARVIRHRQSLVISSVLATLKMKKFFLLHEVHQKFVLSLTFHDLSIRNLYASSSLS